MTMCSKETLVSYLYDELQGPERKAFQHHLVSCRECQEEVQGLRAARSHLDSWSVPDAALGLQVAGAAAAPSRFRISPSWGLAAAAVLLLAVASAVANVEIKTGADGVTIRTGWGREAPAPNTTAAVDAASREDLAAIQQRLRELEASLAAGQANAIGATPVSLSSGGGTASADRLRDAEIVRRVRQWITESEQRQQQMLAARLVQVMREMQAEHGTDLVRLEQAINRSQGIWNDEIFRQREEMKQFYRLVNSQQQR
jgi:hypothetical protein